MNEEALAEANHKIQSEKVNLLGAKQIGLFVVNRLRERQGLPVELRASPNGGVPAALLVPEGLLRDDCRWARRRSTGAAWPRRRR